MYLASVLNNKGINALDAGNPSYKMPSKWVPRGTTEAMYNDPVLNLFIFDLEILEMGSALKRAVANHTSNPKPA